MFDLQKGMNIVKKTVIFFLSCVWITLAGISINVAEAADSLFRAATQSDYPPFSYIGEDNVLKGYDVEFMQEISKRLEGYSIDISTLGWDAMFLALESRTIDLIGDEVAITEQRKERYLYSDPYFDARSVIVVKKGRTDIRTIADLEGKVVNTYIGDNYTKLLEDYNSTHSNKIKLEYVSDVPHEDRLLGVQNGRYDAVVGDPLRALTAIERHNLQVEIVGEPVHSVLVGLVFNKDEKGQKLKELIDPIIQELKKDGTLSELCVKWTGGDFVPK
jgi:L-cystine transport system substrate-binding protein